MQSQHPRHRHPPQHPHHQPPQHPNPHRYAGDHRRTAKSSPQYTPSRTESPRLPPRNDSPPSTTRNDSPRFSPRSDSPRLPPRNDSPPSTTRNNSPRFTPSRSESPRFTPSRSESPRFTPSGSDNPRFTPSRRASPRLPPWKSDSSRFTPSTTISRSESPRFTPSGSDSPCFTLSRSESPRFTPSRSASPRLPPWKSDSSRFTPSTTISRSESPRPKKSQSPKLKHRNGTERRTGVRKSYAYYEESSSSPAASPTTVSPNSTFLGLDSSSRGRSRTKKSWKQFRKRDGAAAHGGSAVRRGSWSDRGGYDKSGDEDRTDVSDLDILDTNPGHDLSSEIASNSKIRLSHNPSGMDDDTAEKGGTSEFVGSSFRLNNDFEEDHTYKNTTMEDSDNPTIKTSSMDALTEDKKQKLCYYVTKNIVGSDRVFKGPYGRNFITYVDYIASGKPLKCIENYILKHVMPVYANTHTEASHTAQQTSLFREEARTIIREAVNASEDDAVIFVGSGATSAVNKLVYALKPINPVVFIGPYEHHSNILPWLEINAKVVRIPLTKDGLIDLHRLHWEIQRRYCRTKSRMLIGSFSAASNITGILADVNAITAIIHKYRGVVFFDYACAAPYVEIDMNPEINGGPDGLLFKDAVFISPHKFIGGPGTPGILVAKRHLFNNPIPHNTGGGTVNFVRRKSHRYLVDPEHREEGGTPAIIESIRAGLVFKLKQTFTAEFIMDKEEEFYRIARQAWCHIPNLILLGNPNVVRLPIFPLMFFNKKVGRFIHHNFMSVVLNDVFGIQTRSGCACAGPYAMDLMGVTEHLAGRIETLIGIPPDPLPSGRPPHNEPFTNNIFKPGFVRLNIPYFISEPGLYFVIKAIELASQHGWALLPQYEFDRNSGNWRHKSHKRDNKDHLHYASFDSGYMEVVHTKEPRASDSLSSSLGSSRNSATEIGLNNYSEIIQRAEGIFTEALNGKFDVEDQTGEFTGEADTLRWFMLPSEAANIIHKRKVKHLKVTELPFLPEPLAKKLGVQSGRA